MWVLLLNFLCFYLSFCKSSCHFLWSELCTSVIPGISVGIMALDPREDIVLSLLLLRSCCILMLTQFRHLVACCKMILITLIIDWQDCCNSLMQQLRLPFLNLIVGCATFLMQWQDFVLFLLFVMLILQFAIFQILQLVLICDFMRLILQKFLTDTLQRYARLLRLGLVILQPEKAPHAHAFVQGS